MCAAMRTGGTTLAMICGLLAAMPASAAASALKPGISPKAVAWLGAPPACPAAEVVDGRETARAARDLLTGKTRVSSLLTDELLGEDSDDFSRSFLASLAIYTVAATPAAVLTVCDPAVAGSGQALGTITGDARDVPDVESIGAGLRSRGGTFGRATAAAAIGDRFVLPPTNAGALLDVAVDTTNGAASVRIGPVGAPPTAVRIAGQLEAPQVIVDYADGPSTTHPVTPPAPVKTTVAAKTSKNVLVLAVKAAPGAFVSSSASDPSSTDSMDSFSDPSDLQLVGASGAVTVRLGPLSSGMREAELSVVDPDRRALDSWACKLRWRKTHLRSVTCAGGPDTSDRPRVGAPKFGAAALRTAAARTSRAEPGVAPSARAAGAPALAKITATAMLRPRGDEGLDLVDSIEESQPFFADVTGDGRPETAYGDGQLEQPTLLVSAAAGGWKPVRLRTAYDLFPSDLSSAGDLNGDGVEELWSVDLDGNARAIAGDRAWSTAPPKALDVRTGTAGPRDLLTSGEVPPVPIADSTGDGRAELVLGLSASVTKSGLATFASNDVPLGQRLNVPLALSTDPGSTWAWVADEALAAQQATYDPESSVVVTRDGLVTVAPVTGADGKPRIALVRLSPDGRSLSPLAAFATAGSPQLAGYDPTSGELLVATSSEACKQRRCVSRVLRLDPTGKTLGGIALRGIGAVTAHFVDDGPDADARAEVVVRDPDGDYGDRRKSTIPGAGRTIARWDSATGSPAWKRLPVLAIGSAAIQPHGPLMGWTSAAGKHHVGTWSLRGKGRQRSAVLLDLTTPK